VVASGLLKVVVTSEDGEEMVLVTLGLGEALGELAVVDGGPPSASAEALEPTEVLVITRDALLELAARDRGLTEALLLALGRLLRRLTEQAADLVFLDLPGRVAKLLSGLAAERGSPVADGVELDAHLTQSDLARMVGASRQSVNQILQGSRLAGGPRPAHSGPPAGPAAPAGRHRTGVGRMTARLVGCLTDGPTPTGDHPGWGERWRSSRDRPTERTGS
jgi:CRP-like cAMP-binding protein